MRSFDLRAALAHLAAQPCIVGLGPACLRAPGEGPGEPAAPPARGLDAFFEATGDPMLVYGPDLSVTAANVAAGRFLRVPAHELPGRSVLENTLLARILTAASVPQRLRDTVALVRDDVTVADAEGQPLQCRVEAMHMTDGQVLLHLQDTTAALRMRSALRLLEESQRSLADVLPGVTWTMALPEERLLEVSPAIERIFGWQPAALLQDPELWDALAHPSDRERVRAEFRSGVASGRPFEIRFTGLHRERRDLPHLVNRVVPVRDENGWTGRAQGFIEDLGARTALEADLAAARVQLRHILDTVPAGVLVVRPGRDGPEVALCNRRFAEMLRLDEPLRPGTPLARTSADLKRLLKGPDAAREVEDRLVSDEVDEMVAELKDPPRVLRTWAGPLRDAHAVVSGRILTAEDITTTWAMQRRLTQAQKMESLGRLAGGVAHDFNNLLGTVLGFGSLLLEQTPPSDPRREPVTRIVDAAERGARLTQALLDFSRSARFERLPLHLNRVVEDAYQLLRSVLDPSVSLVMRLEPELPLLLGDALLLKQVVVDLTQEVRDRLGTGGVLTLVTRMIEQTRPPEEGHAEAEPRHAVALELHVAPGSATRRAVEPLADHAGLTLTIVEDIVRAHGGWLLVAPASGDAAFSAVFPVDTPEETPLLVPEAATAHGHETVLVVDDESGLRALARIGLQQCGFDVVAVGSGEEALDILRKGALRVDAMVLDLTLPGITGESVLQEVRRLVPGLPVLIASGYTSVESQSTWADAGAAGFVAKPFHIQQLAGKLRDVLDRRHPQVKKS